MLILIIAIAALVCDAITYIPSCGVASIVGFTFGIAVWVISRKIRQYEPQNKLAKTTMVLGIVGTFAGAVGVLVSFVIGSLLWGSWFGFMNF